MILRVFVKSICPFSGDKSTPTSSFASLIAPCKLSSPFTTEPPTHSRIRGCVGLFAERCEIRYSPLELRIHTCTTKWYPSIGSCSPLTRSLPRSSLLSLYKSQISAFLRRSDLLISLSTNNFHNRLYETAITPSPTYPKKSFCDSCLPSQKYHKAMRTVASHVQNSHYKQWGASRYLSL